MSFTEHLAIGQYGEDLISRWLISRGWQVLPAYQIEIPHGKGPRLFGGYGQLISPDLLVFKKDKTLWVEAKHKSAFSWHRRTESWQTGIDLLHWKDYLRVAEETPFGIWLMFLHKPGFVAKDTPLGLVCPSGLFVNSITRLQQSVDHESDKHGPSGMVYWQESALIKKAEYAEMEARP